MGPGSPSRASVDTVTVGVRAAAVSPPRMAGMAAVGDRGRPGRVRVRASRALTLGAVRRGSPRRTVGLVPRGALGWRIGPGLPRTPGPIVPVIVVVIILVLVVILRQDQGAIAAQGRGRFHCEQPARSNGDDQGEHEEGPEPSRPRFAVDQPNRDKAAGRGRMRRIAGRCGLGSHGVGHFLGCNRWHRVVERGSPALSRPSWQGGRCGRSDARRPAGGARADWRPRGASLP